MDGRTDRFPLCSTGLRPLRGRCPKRREKEEKKKFGMGGNDNPYRNGTGTSRSKVVDGTRRFKTGLNIEIELEKEDVMDDITK